MITEELRQQLLFWISRVVFAQVALVAAISFMTFLLLVYRQWYKRRMAMWKEKYGDMVVEELLLNMEGQKSEILPNLGTFRYVRYASLKETLLGQIRSINGTEKSYLTKRYFDLGMVKSDMSMCASGLWWQRLHGVSNLRVLTSPRLAKVFDILKNDKNELVAAAANLALSELPHELNQINLHELVPLIAQGRQSNLVEIAANWCQVHGFEKVFRMVHEYPEIEIRNALLLAMISVRTPDSAVLLSEFLAGAHYDSPELLSETIRALRETGDPVSLPVITEYLYHPDERVQARAIEFVLEFLPEERRHELRVLEVDPSPHVQRLMRTWSVRKVA